MSFVGFAMLTVSPAAADPVERGVQAQVYPEAFAFAGDQLTQGPIDFGPYTFSTYYDCYYELDVYDFNLSVEIDSVSVELNSGSLELDVQLGQVRGEDIDVSGYSGYFDLCIDFDTTIQYLELRDGRIRGTLVADPTAQGGVRLSFQGDPQLSGTFDSEIYWFPDDIVWAFFGDLVLEEIGAYAVDALPGLLEEPISGVFDSPLGDLQISASISDLDSTSEGLYAAADIDIGGDGDRSGPRLDLDPKGDSHFAVGLSDAMVRDVLQVAWDGGVLDDQAASAGALIDDLVETLGLPEDVHTTLELGSEPEVSIDGDGVGLSIPEATLLVDDGDENLLTLVVDLGATLEPDVRADEANILLSAHDVDIRVEELDADHLVEDQQGEDHLRDFLQGWVADAVSTSLDDTPVFGSRFAAWGYVLRLDELELQDDGVATWFTVFDEDDPQVDLVPPDTLVTPVPHGSRWTAKLAGADDRQGSLWFSWRVDGGSWSVWTEAHEVDLPPLDPGEHAVEAIARDGWQNEDPTPASTKFTVSKDGAGDGKDKKGCGCGSSPDGGATGVLVAGMVLALRRGRRRSR